MGTCTSAHVVITGASSGIGRATALHLARSGHHVFAGVRKQADGDALKDAAPGCAITPLLLNVTDPVQIGSAVEAVTEHTGLAGLDGLVNNAGIGVFSPVELTPLADFRRLLEVNVTGQLAVTQAFLPLLRRAQGRIVMIGSIGVRFIPPYVGPLAASKSALDTLANALRQELAPWNIGVSTVEPASIHSEAVGKLDQDLENLLAAAVPSRRSLYEESLRRMVRIFADQHRQGSPPEVAAKVVAHALTSSRPRAHYLAGKNSRRMAIMAAVLPTPLLDALRRRRAQLPAPGSLVRCGR